MCINQMSFAVDIYHTAHDDEGVGRKRLDYAIFQNNIHSSRFDLLQMHRRGGKNRAEAATGPHVSN